MTGSGRSDIGASYYGVCGACHDIGRRSSPEKFFHCIQSYSCLSELTCRTLWSLNRGCDRDCRPSLHDQGRHTGRVILQLRVLVGSHFNSRVNSDDVTGSCILLDYFRSGFIDHVMGFCRHENRETIKECCRFQVTLCPIQLDFAHVVE